MTRRNVKRVDYKNIKPINVYDSSPDESSDQSDDDFVSSLTPPPSKKNKSTTKKKPKKKTTKTSDTEHCLHQDLLTAVEVSEGETVACSLEYDDNENDFDISGSRKIKNSDNMITGALDNDGSKGHKTDSTQQAEKRKRRSKNSNPEDCFEKDLLTAIEISQAETVKCSAKYADNEDDFDSGSLHTSKSSNRKRPTRTKGKNCKENLPVNSDTCGSGGNESVSDEKNPVREKHPIKSSLSNNSVQSITRSVPSTPLLSKKIDKVLTPDISTVLHTKSKVLTPTQNSTINTEKALTPGRLRLGLSRNIRIAKPLHRNATVS